MSYSPNTYLFNTLTEPIGGGTYAITWDFPGNFSNARIYVNQVLLVEDTDYTLFRDGNGRPIRIEFILTQVASANVTIERFTSRTVGVNFQSGETVSNADHTAEALRGAAVDEEIEFGSVGNALTGEFMAKSYLGQYNAGLRSWEGQGLVASNFNVALINDDLTTLAQVQALIAGADLVDLDNAVVCNFDGDGAETKFLLSPANGGAIIGVANRGLLNVFVDFVYQSAEAGTPTYTLLNPGDGGYTGDGTHTQIEFSGAPPTGTDNVEVRNMSGTIRVTAQNLSIGTEELEDNAVTAAKLVDGTDKQVFINDGTTPTLRVLTHDDVSDFDAGVRTNRLDQMAVPGETLLLGTQKAKDVLPYSVSDSGDHVASKTNVDAAITTANGYTDQQVAAASFVRYEEVSVETLEFTHETSDTIILLSIPDYIEIIGVTSQNTPFISPIFFSTKTFLQPVGASIDFLCGGTETDTGIQLTRITTLTWSIKGRIRTSGNTWREFDIFGGNKIEEIKFIGIRK